MNEQSTPSSGKAQSSGKSGGGFLVGLVIGVIVGALSAAWIQPMLESRPGMKPDAFQGQPTTGGDRDERPSETLPETEGDLEDATGEAQDAMDEAADAVEEGTEGDGVETPSEPEAPTTGGGR